MPDTRMLTGVFVTFDLGADFDPEQLTRIAAAAAAKFIGLPGLRSKTFTLDPATRQAINFYVWESETEARRFFSDEALAGVARVYGVRPTLRYVSIAERVENPPRAG